MDVLVVADKTGDYSIPNGIDIKHFEQGTDQEWLAGGDANFIYRSVDGGKSWTQVTVSANATDVCSGLVMFDALNAACLMGGRIFYSTNGGQTWTGSTNYPDYIAKAPDNKLLIFDQTFDRCSLFVSTNNGQTSTYHSRFFIPSGLPDLIRPKVCGNLVYLLTDDDDYEDEISGINYNTKVQSNVKISTEIHSYSDLYVSEDISGVVVTFFGEIARKSYTNYGVRAHYKHTYPYYCVEGKGNRIVAVGENTIAVNASYQEGESWSEVYDADGNFFDYTFYTVKIADNENIFVTGNKGTIWKLKIGLNSF